MTEKVVCNKCGATYEDEESIYTAKKWIRAGYAPCPNIACPGELELKEKEHAQNIPDKQPEDSLQPIV